MANRWLFIGLLCLQQFLGGLTFPVVKFGLTNFDPFTYAFFRFCLSTVVLLLIVGKRKKGVAIDKKDYIKIIGLGVLIIPFNQTAYLFGQKLTAAGHGAVLFATVPLWIFILALVQLKERFSWQKAAGVGLGLVGMALIMKPVGYTISREYILGDMIILWAVISWALYSVMGKPLAQKYGAIRITAYALASGSAIYFPFGLWRAIRFDYSPVSWSAWLTIVYAALGVSVVAYILWYWLLKHMEASRIAVFHYIQPVVASSVAFVFLNESLDWHFIAGGLIVLAGVFITESGSGKL